MSINDSIDGTVLAVLQALGVELPGGDGDTLRGIARAWDTMGSELTGVGQALRTAVTNVDQEGWHGGARDAFEKRRQLQRETIDNLASNLHQVAEGLREYADEIDTINKAIIDICVQIAEMEVAGAALSFFTGFLSDLVANTAVAERVAEIFDLVEKFAEAAEKVAALIERVAGLSEEVAATVEGLLVGGARLSGTGLTAGAKSFATNFVANGAGTMLDDVMNGQGIDFGDVAAQASAQAAGSALFDGGGEVVAETESRAGRLVKVLTGEGRMASAANSAMSGAVGSVAGDYFTPQPDSDYAHDVLWTAGFGVVGDGLHGAHIRDLTERGSYGGENLSDRAELTDAAYEEAHAVGINTVAGAAQSGIDADRKAIRKDYKKLIEDA